MNTLRKPLNTSGEAEGISPATSTGKTPVKTAVDTVLQPNGGALLTDGQLGNRGGGRPRDEFKRWMQQMANGEKVARGLSEILKTGPAHELWMSAVKHVTEHGYGKPGGAAAERQHVDTRRVVGAFHLAITELSSPQVSDMIRVRVEQLLTEPEVHSAS